MSELIYYRYADNVDGSDEDAGDDYYVAKASKKKEKKRQEREARQAEDAARESKQTKQDRYAEMRRRKDEAREAEERHLEEEALARKAKEEEATAVEFDKWKGEFSVDAEGTTESDMQEGGQGLLSDFVEYIKKHKCVPLEDLAAEFKLRTQEEMKAVADYIKRQGRVSISHLASKSNQFIDLEPKALFTEEINNSEVITVG
ncbi:hypothetical protein Scep_028733 [Stephania cephalantha]|uniref:DDRGK domain-containing protein 1 n=1 Tax=Stephania cephalantha TaxID=152367 RepID=A0AAP0EAG9_9MAGN